MLVSKKPIGILGGTFDPIHLGHIEIAKLLLNDLNLHNIHFIPNNASPLREKTIADSQHRLAMVKIAVAPYPQFLANDIEIARPAPSYTIDTVKALRKSIPDQPLCLIMGADVFHHFNEWHQWEKIPEYVHMLVVTRIDHITSQPLWMKEFLKKRQTLDSQDLFTSPSGKIYFHRIKPINISGTDIRRKIAEGKDVSNELPKKVLDYIQQHHLYH